MTNDLVPAGGSPEPRHAPQRVAAGVRRERSVSGTHEYIAGLTTRDGRYFDRDEVVRALDAGGVWFVDVAGQRIPIRRVTHCPCPGCPLTPYIAAPSGRRRDALERL